jgi:hypothetical protein
MNESGNVYGTEYSFLVCYDRPEKMCQLSENKEMDTWVKAVMFGILGSTLD